MAHTREGIRELNREEIAAVTGGLNTSSSSSGPFARLWEAVCIAERIYFCLVGSTVAKSDARLKRDVTPVGALPNGLSLYRFRYLDGDTQYVGVMAQEVEQVVPEAVVRGADGYLQVNYRRLGIRMQTWDQWRAAA